MDGEPRSHSKYPNHWAYKKYKKYMTFQVKLDGDDDNNDDDDDGDGDSEVVVALMVVVVVVTTMKATY